MIVLYWDILFLEPFRHVESDYAGIEREDVGGQSSVVRVDEKVGDRRIVEQVLYVELKDQIGCGSRQGHGDIDVVPGPKPVEFGIVNAREAARLAVVIAAKGQFPRIDEKGVLRADIGGHARRIGQFVARQICVKASSAVGCAAAALSDVQTDRVRIVGRQRIIGEAISLVEPIDARYAIRHGRIISAYARRAWTQCA